MMLKWLKYTEYGYTLNVIKNFEFDKNCNRYLLKYIQRVQQKFFQLRIFSKWSIKADFTKVLKSFSFRYI